MSRRLAIALFGVALALGTLACDGDGGGGGPTSPPPGVSFTPSGTPGVETLYLESGPGGNSTLLVLELRANQITDLYAVSFQLNYPENLLAFSQANEGGLLRDGGQFSTSFQVVESEPGSVVVGLTRLGQVPGATGSGVVARFEFQSKGVAGSQGIDFSFNEAFSSEQGETLDATWLGGRVTVTL